MSTHDHDHSHQNHDHQNHGNSDAEDLYSQETWDARYSGTTKVWSGNPNPRLVEQVAGLTPGTALDVGAGEGADAVWLAQQGWEVTALDVSEVALTRTTAHAVEAGVGDRVTPVHHDLMLGDPLPGSYDLVSAQFWHPPAAERAEHVTRIGAAVRPGGTLLVVGHHPADLSTGMRSGHGHAERVFTAEQIAAILPADSWDIQVAAAQTREVVGEDGPVTLTDAVLRAVRR